ncbi:MAG: glucose 1-dehydrogenase [Chloroflexi bacterium]|nr:glucose 1-dehydrogenase [Chloroflexota bacterium]
MDFPSSRVDGQIAAVTGGGSGIGRAAAWALARAGADVVLGELPHLIGRAEEAADQIASATGRQAVALPLDVTRTASIASFVAGAVERFGRLDILVNSAGVNRTRPALEVTEEDWDFVLDVNLKGLFFCCQAAAREMIKQKRGKIINLASINGVVGYVKRAAYCASKGGVVNLTRALAIEWAPHGINVNAVGPTYIETPLTVPTLSDPETRADILRRTPLGRIGRVEDVAGAIVFLASPAADLITGHTLLVDGGWTAW